MDESLTEKGPFLVVLLGIVYNPKIRQVLIGRREDDFLMPKLSWAFPGGRGGWVQELEDHLKDEIKAKTGLDVEVERQVFAKTYPENRQILSIYYVCKTNSTEATASGSFKEVKWIAPQDVEKYFTTSVHPKVLEILKELK